MKLDFSTPMTSYEFLAILISAIALVFPIIKWAWNKWVRKTKVTFLPSGLVSIFFNKSGSYFSFGGVYSAKNKMATVKSISAIITRKSDKAVLELRWSSFSSPIYRKIAGAYETSFETAHPLSSKSRSKMLSGSCSRQFILLHQQFSIAPRPFRFLMLISICVVLQLIKIHSQR